jgi:hypothetical protein
MSQQVTVEQLRSASWRLDLHVNMGRDGSLYSHTCIEFPELGYTFRSHRKKAPERTLHIGDVRIPFPPVEAALDEAARLLSHLRRDRETDAEWEAVAPARVGL